VKAAPERLLFEKGQLERTLEYSLTGMLASGYLAVLGSRALDLPSAVAGGVALVIRILYLAGLLVFQIPARWVTFATIAYLAFYPVDYFYLSKEFIPSTVHLVFFVAVVKLLTARTRRDFLFLKIIALLELLAASLVSDNLTFFVFLILFVFFTVATFASSEMLSAWEGRQVVNRGPLRFSRRFTLLTTFAGLGIVLITGALFFVLPRTARAALEHFLPGNSRIAGLASDVTIGQTGEIRRRSTVLMHVRFDGPAPQGPLRFRGGALAEFNGWKWFNAPRTGMPLRGVDGLFKLADDDQLRRRGRRASYEVSLRGFPVEQIFFIGTPEYLRLPGRTIWQAPTGGYRLPWAEVEGLKYFAYSYLDGGSPRVRTPQLPDAERTANLQLPPLDPRVKQLAEWLAANGRSEEERARTIEQYLRTGFRYSLEPLEHEVDDPLAYFLFERKKGHCEYFASAMAAMLRTIWIPARVVTGFQGGMYNPMSGWHVVRASDAHSWVEAWIPKKGWVEFDPTPADATAVGAGLWTRAGMLLDAAETFWQDWIVGYDLDRQLTLAKQVERTSRRLPWTWFEDAIASLKGAGPAGIAVNRKVAIAGSAIVFAAGVLWFRGPALWGHLRRRARLRKLARGEGTVSDAGLLYESLLEVLQRRGFTKPAFMTPLEFALSMPASETRDAVHEFTLGYYDVRFGHLPKRASELEPLLERIRQIK
jgi:protein-glutamine gamma-glutamyltransferase